MSNISTTGVIGPVAPVTARLISRLASRLVTLALVCTALHAGAAFGQTAVTPTDLRQTVQQSTPIEIITHAPIPIKPITPPEEDLTWRNAPIPAPMVISGGGGPWYSPVIPVCWESDNPEDAQGRRWTEEAVKNTWEAVSSVDFTGWETCADDDYTSVRILAADLAPLTQTTGRNLSGMPSGVILNFTFQEWGQGCAGYMEYCIKALGVHEFGHVLGLAHEHNRADIPTACEEEPQGPMPSYIVTKYDAESIMNYCSEAWNNDGKLSALDVYGIRSIYGPFTQEQPMEIVHSGAVIFSTADEADAVQHDINFTAVMSDETPLVEKNIVICNGDDIRVEITSKTTLEPDSISAIVANETRIYETTNCAPGGTMLSENRSGGSLPVPGESLGGFHAPLIEINENTGDQNRRIDAFLNPRRALGEDVTAENCGDCAAASQIARFADLVPFVSPFNSAALTGTTPAPAPLIPAASPWPSDIKLDLEVCARAVAAGPGFNGDSWSTDNIKVLCQKAPTSEAPAKCYKQLMTDGLNYGAGSVWLSENALTLCAGSTDHEATLACFSEQISANTAWPGAITACRAP